MKLRGEETTARMVRAGDLQCKLPPRVQSVLILYLTRLINVATSRCHDTKKLNLVEQSTIR
jgi:hypothetical protein